MRPYDLVRSLSPFGGDEEDRTPDPLLAKQVLSQLSYTPARLCLEPLVLTTLVAFTLWLEHNVCEISFAEKSLFTGLFLIFKILKFPSESSKLNNDFFHSPC